MRELCSQTYWRSDTGDCAFIESKRLLALGMTCTRETEDRLIITHYYSAEAHTPIRHRLTAAESSVVRFFTPVNGGGKQVH